MLPLFISLSQFGQWNLVIPLLKNSCRALDPIFHLDLLFSRTEAPPNSPAFTYKLRNQLKFVTYKTFTTRLKSLLSKSGFSPEKYSGHSLRRGGATFLYSCGASILQIQSCGDWQSSVFTKYLFISLEQRLLSQQLMASKIGSDFWHHYPLLFSFPSSPLLSSLPAHNSYFLVLAKCFSAVLYKIYIGLLFERPMKYLFHSSSV